MTRNRFWVLLAVLVSRAYSADFSAYIGDQNQYQVAATTADSSGSTYVTGARIIPQQTGGALDDVFVTKLDANGDIVFTTTFGERAPTWGTPLPWIQRATSG